MERAIGIRASAALLVLLLISSSAFAQASLKRDARGKPARSESVGRLYTPRIKAYSESLVIEGRISRIEDGILIIKTARGSRVELETDENTLILESGKEVSIAAMADISLSASDLKVWDLVEIVVERAGRRAVARIITRIAREDAQVAKR
jgi:hypothetical protein